MNVHSTSENLASLSTTYTQMNAIVQEPDKMLFNFFRITLGEYSTVVQKITDLARLRISSCIYLANVHMLIEAKNNPAFAQNVNVADIVAADGMPLVLSLKALFGIKQERIAGMDLLHTLLAETAQQKLSIYFYGETAEVLASIKERCLKEYPTLRIAGMYSPPFRELTEEEDESVARQINDSGANLVLVALGCPKQEVWMAGMKGRVNAVMVGIGAAFSVYAGIKGRSPRWMQRMSLEWLFRLSQEPERLWKRYLITNSQFMWLFAREWLKVKLF